MQYPVQIRDMEKILSFEHRAATQPERRREFREVRHVPVEIFGFDSCGRFFTERSSAIEVSDSGCSFLLNAEVAEHSAVSVRVIRRPDGIVHRDPPVLFRVAWTNQTYPGWPKWTVAGAKLPPVQLWTVGVPVDADNAECAPSDSSGSPDRPDREPPAA